MKAKQKGWLKESAVLLCSKRRHKQTDGSSRDMVWTSSALINTVQCPLTDTP